MTKRIVLIASHGVQALDVTGPASVFSAANEGGFKKNRLYSVEVLSPEGGLIEACSGVAINSGMIANAPRAKIDTVLIAGHNRQGTKELIASAPAKKWVLDAASKARRWGSVCSGAFPLAAWGLVRGKKVATHWSASDELAARYPETAVDEHSLYVVDGKIWTSAGVTAGIDMALAMVEADHGPELAAEIARRLVVYLRRPGGQSQFSNPLRAQTAAAAPYAGLIEWAKGNLKNDLSIEPLAAQAGQSARTFQRRFAQTVGQTPAAFVEDLRIDRAKALIACDVPLQTVAEEIGFPNASQLTASFRRRLGVAPSVWKAMHCT